jgi:hypothetical protein
MAVVSKYDLFESSVTLTDQHQRGARGQNVKMPRKAIRRFPAAAEAAAAAGQRRHRHNWRRSSPADKQAHLSRSRHRVRCRYRRHSCH